MQFTELDSSKTIEAHPISHTKVSGHKGSPQGYPLVLTPSCGNIEADTARQLIMQDTEGVMTTLVFDFPLQDEKR